MWSLARLFPSVRAMIAQRDAAAAKAEALAAIVEDLRRSNRELEAKYDDLVRRVIDYLAQRGGPPMFDKSATAQRPAPAPPPRRPYASDIAAEATLSTLRELNEAVKRGNQIRG